MRKKSWKACMWLSILLAHASWALALISVSYFWGYDQRAIDQHTADFSAPASVNLINGIPWLLGTLLFGILAFLFYRKAK